MADRKTIDPALLESLIERLSARLSGEKKSLVDFVPTQPVSKLQGLADLGISPREAFLEGVLSEGDIDEFLESRLTDDMMPSRRRTLREQNEAIKAQLTAPRPTGPDVQFVQGMVAPSAELLQGGFGLLQKGAAKVGIPESFLGKEPLFSEEERRREREEFGPQTTGEFISNLAGQLGGFVAPVLATAPFSSVPVAFGTAAGLARLGVSPLIQRVGARIMGEAAFGATYGAIRAPELEQRREGESEGQQRLRQAKGDAIFFAGLGAGFELIGRAISRGVKRFRKKKFENAEEVRNAVRSLSDGEVRRVFFGGEGRAPFIGFEERPFQAGRKTPGVVLKANLRTPEGRRAFLDLLERERRGDVAESQARAVERRERRLAGLDEKLEGLEGEKLLQKVREQKVAREAIERQFERLGGRPRVRIPPRRPGIVRRPKFVETQRKISRLKRLLPRERFRPADDPKRFVRLLEPQHQRFLSEQIRKLSKTGTIIERMRELRTTKDVFGESFRKKLADIEAKARKEGRGPQEMFEQIAEEFGLPVRFRGRVPIKERLRPTGTKVQRIPGLPERIGGEVPKPSRGRPSLPKAPKEPPKVLPSGTKIPPVRPVERATPSEPTPLPTGVPLTVSEPNRKAVNEAIAALGRARTFREVQQIQSEKTIRQAIDNLVRIDSAESKALRRKFNDARERAQERLTETGARAEEVKGIEKKPPLTPRKEKKPPPPKEPEFSKSAEHEVKRRQQRIGWQDSLKQLRNFEKETRPFLKRSRPEVRERFKAAIEKKATNLRGISRAKKEIRTKSIKVPGRTVTVQRKEAQFMLADRSNALDKAKTVEEVLRIEAKMQDALDKAPATFVTEFRQSFKRNFERVTTERRIAEAAKGIPTEGKLEQSLTKAQKEIIHRRRIREGGAIEPEMLGLKLAQNLIDRVKGRKLAKDVKAAGALKGQLENVTDEMGLRKWIRTHSVRIRQLPEPLQAEVFQAFSDQRSAIRAYRLAQIAKTRTPKGEPIRLFKDVETGEVRGFPRITKSQIAGLQRKGFIEIPADPEIVRVKLDMLKEKIDAPWAPRWRQMRVALQGTGAYPLLKQATIDMDSFLHVWNRKAREVYGAIYKEVNPSIWNRLSGEKLVSAPDILRPKKGRPARNRVTAMVVLKNRRLSKELRAEMETLAKGATPEERQIADRVTKMINDPLFKIGVGEKFFTWDQYVEGYMTRIYKRERFSEAFPEARNLEGVSAEAFSKGVDKLPHDVAFWATLHRSGELHPMELDSAVLISAYLRGFSRRAYLQPALRKIQPLMPAMSKEQQELVGEYFRYLRGLPTKSQERMNYQIQKIVKWAEGLPGGVVPKGKFTGLDSMQLARYVTDWFYMTGLGFRVSSALKNLTQPLLTFGEIGGRHLLVGMKEATTQDGMRLLKKSGVIAEFAPMLEREWGLTRDTWGRFRDSSLWMFRSADTWNRAVSYLGGRSLFLETAGRGPEAVGKLLKMKIRGGRPSPRIDEKRAILRAFELGEKEKAANLYGRFVVFETQYPYGRADTPLAWRGPLGRFMSQFMTWPAYHAELLLRWAQQGDYQKFARYIASVFVLAEGTRFAFGLDIESWFFTRHRIGAAQIPVPIPFGSLPKGLAPAPRAVVGLAKIAAGTVSGSDFLFREGKAGLRGMLDIGIGIQLAETGRAVGVIPKPKSRADETRGESLLRVVGFKRHRLDRNKLLKYSVNQFLRGNRTNASTALQGYIQTTGDRKIMETFLRRVRSEAKQRAMKKAPRIPATP